MGSRVLIAMSGGVDSSAAALLLKEQGFHCIGCTMRLYGSEAAGISDRRTCCGLDDVEDARAAAFRLGIPYYVFNFKDVFRKEVMEKFARCYESGLTPNPCIDCNRYIKFGKLYRRARELGCDYIATGHYARIGRAGGRYTLKKALDETKDQSYVLYAMTQEQLAHTLFPLGELRKAEVRRIAGAGGLVNAQKPDSQDICFAPDGDYAAAVERISGRTAVPGPFLDRDGNILGRHRGVIHYTVGQRRGLGLSSPEPLYVCRISAQENTVTLGGRETLLQSGAEVREFHWISGCAPEGTIRCGVKIRYCRRECPAAVTPLEGNRLRIAFDQPQRAVTPGQAAVLYDGDVVLGGGVLV